MVFRPRRGQETATDQLTRPEILLITSSLSMVALLTLRGLSSCLWLDETGTYWVIKDGLPSLSARSWAWPGASAVYDLTAWAGSFLRPLVGLEASLRLPSIISAVAAGVLLYRIGARLLNRRAALIAVVAMFCTYDVAFAAIDARPYSLGLALLLASMYSLIRFLDTPDRRFGMAYVSASALLVYTHYFLALGLAAQLVYGWTNRRKLWMWWSAIGAACFPLTGHFLSLYRMRGEHLFAGTPQLPELLRSCAPPALAAALFLSGIFGRPRDDAPGPIPRAFLLVWALFPPLLLFLVALIAQLPVFVPRYLLSVAPAIALLAGWLLSRVTSVGAGCTLLAIAFVCAYGKETAHHGTDDWRAASAALNAQTAPGDAILVASGFVEATPADLRRDVLFGPQLAYPIPGFVRLPRKPVESALPDDFGGERRVFLLCYQSQLKYADWIGAKRPGYRERTAAAFGDLVLTRFDPQ